MNSSPSFTTLISPVEVVKHLADPNWVIVDCRFSLDEPERGRREFFLSHIPTAVYAHLEEDLSGPVIPGKTGRHPLPPTEALVAKLSSWGIGTGVQVVAYDDMGGSIAARLWWLLHWLGHRDTAVLDGGWQRWRQENLPVQVGGAAAGQEHRRNQIFVPNVQFDLLVSREEVDAMRIDPHSRIIDARTADRYRGESEPIDPIAGHIPGAVSAPYGNNLTSEGVFQPPQTLRKMYEGLLEGTPVERTAVYCGSGVTAAHDVLALAHSGLGYARLYAGSWSEWITYPDHPIARGDDEAGTR